MTAACAAAGTGAGARTAGPATVRKMTTKVREEPEGSGVYVQDENGTHQLIPMSVMLTMERLFTKLLDFYQFPANHREAFVVFEWFKENGFMQDTEAPQPDIDERL